MEMVHQHLLLPSEPKAVALADMNGDGDVDMLVANFGAQTLAVWLGQSDGRFLDPGGLGAIVADPSTPTALPIIRGN